MTTKVHPSEELVAGDNAASPNKERPGNSTSNGNGNDMAQTVIQTVVSRKTDRFYKKPSFAIEQISEKSNSTALRRSKFSQKAAGVILTKSAEVVLEKGKCVAVNDYFFLKTLGKGAFGEVKLATKDLVEDDLSEDHDRFAIKVLRRLNCNSNSSRGSFGSRGPPGNTGSSLPASDPSMATLSAALQQEINIMKLLVHKNLVRLVEIINDESARHVYLVLEHVEGGPIMSFDAPNNRFVYRLTGTTMGESTARRSFKDLISGLSFMHANHIAHRDIKPDNLLVDFKGNLKLSDFGVSNHFESDRAKVSISMRDLKKSTSRGITNKTEGTFPFYSPEMCAESSSSYSAYMADTWAACVCLWIFVFGQLPFYHKDVTELFRIIRDVDPLRPHGVSPELDHLLTVSLCKDSGQRPYVHEMHYHPFITGEPLEILSARDSSKSRTFRDETHELGPINITPGVKYRFKKLAKKAREICRERQEEFIINAKMEINLLVRKKLSEAMGNLTTGPEAEALSEDSFSGDDSDASSGASDPLGLLVTNMDDDGATFEPGPNQLSPSGNRPSTALKVERFLQFNVLDSMEETPPDDRKNGDYAGDKFLSKFFCCFS